MSNFRIVGQIKKEVDQAFERQYSRHNQNKELKHYSLYIPSIIKIQRNFRKYLVRKNTFLEQQISQKLAQRIKLHNKRNEIQAKIILAKEKRERLRMMDVQRAALDQKENIQNNLQKMIGNVIHTADKYSQNVAVSKIQLNQFQKLTLEQEELECEVKELELEKQCYEQRVAGWKQKLTQIRKRIMEENMEKRKFQEQLWRLG